MNTQSLLVACGVCMGIFGCASPQVDRDIRDITAAMSLEQKVGQLFMVGNLADNLESNELFSVYHFGNVFLGYDDINNLDPAEIAQLTARLRALMQEYNLLPPLIATDQEGGVVNRVRKGVVLFPGEEYVGSRLSGAQAETLALYTAQQLKAIGINTNFSPVVDVNTNKNSHIAKNKRAFSAQPAAVAQYAAAYMAGYRNGGVIGCAKHFPGYGDVAPDPHRVLPSTNKTLAELRACELVPYTALIASGSVDLIMTAHILAPQVSGAEPAPATISYEIIQQLLRNTMKYNGVIVTDDLNMGAMASGHSIEDHAVRCINAGVDILLFVGRLKTQKQAWQGVMKAVQDGRISEQRLQESVMRILKLKKKYGLLHPSPIADSSAVQNREQYRAFLDEITSKERTE